MKILVVKLSSLGDLFHALPAVHNIKVQTGAQIDWATHAPYADLAGCFDDVDRVIAVPRHQTLAQARAWLPALRSERYDLVLDMQGLLKSALVARLARRARVLGPSFHREGSRLFYHAVAGPRDRSRHAVNENLDFVAKLNLGKIEPVFPVTFPERPAQGDRPRIALLPASRWPTKTWPPGHFAETARRLLPLRPTFFLMGGADSVAACTRIEADLEGRAINLAGKTDLIETGSVLQHMDLLIANDSGPVHMAAALGIPALTIFGATDPARTGPYGKKHQVVRAALDCPPCHSRSCRRHDRACLQELAPETVAQTAARMLDANRQSA